ncbi:hypothetical protein FHR83_006361 [Actinoplanes campanulatus]|uniref:Lipoprotein n=1 Tax=Actinoplanes campanulatus TaxID=113559 RepID=A0A7W5AMA9_9ACTN|nr:hypothetical protein [Actinoplanes campanulatus]MBB3098662.1 hypothetical protein [Actinoplanes campanulatus]GGN36378.1 hypothetical protein GCM10010109_61290 [Actinoplanes campanulatus]GID39352.1 hypothetical protein Aca09nite_58580 [Actinoplanes campanulatus]
MKRSILVMAGLAMVVLGGCSNDEPAAAGGPEAAVATEAAGGTEAAPSPELTGSAELRCLIEGSPWHVSKTDLETQLQGVMQGIDVTGVHMTGDQTLTVTPALKATFTDGITTTLTADLGGGITMRVTQKHTGTASGGWQVDGNTLTPHGAWTGGIKIDNKVTINGRSANAPIPVPENPLGDVPMTYTCVDGVLNLQAQGSPFIYLFR